MNIFQRLLILVVILLTASMGFAQELSEDADNPAATPTPRTEDWAVAQHNSIIAHSKWPSSRVVFLGDSITHGLQYGKSPEGGAAVWAKYFSPLNAVTFSVPGDKTQHLLWRITEGGELDGLNPKVVVVLIGINNLTGNKNTTEQTAEGVTAIVTAVKTKLPHTKILLLGIFPCWERDRVTKTNAIIAKLEDLKQVYYLDLGHKFIEPDGKISRETLRDGIHPSEVGYNIWAQAMGPYLEDLLKNDGKSEIWKNRVDGKPAN
ncbi:MAG: hypothetical protein JKX85_12910 [Phycisphaeraceae bacterium]|nr:hypothetical protein [Phycisphaeraceae bacterium]